MAEVGVYQGCSARIISTASDARSLHLFDTFTGLPSPEAGEHDRMRTGHYAASLASVQDFLSAQSYLSFHPGFPDTAELVAEKPGP